MAGAILTLTDSCWMDSSHAFMDSFLTDFGLSASTSQDILHAIWGVDENGAHRQEIPEEALKKWLLLLPQTILRQINLALNQERPFMPPDITPEMFAEFNLTVPSLNQIEILYRCLDFAIRSHNYEMASALVFVVDRACYRFGRSPALLRVVDEIMHISPTTAIAPQVILRKARVMKDSGDLHGSIRILDAVISRESNWAYKDAVQYENTKAVCVQIKGQILQSLGLLKEAVYPLVESVYSFRIVNDDKGISSSLGLLSKCLNKLGASDYLALQQQFPDMFQEEHPCKEAHRQAMQSVQLIQPLGATLYVSKHQLIAVESLLMFVIQQRGLLQQRPIFHSILEEMKHSLAGHRTVHFLHSAESFFEFVRAVFMISLTLHFSPVEQDANLSRYLEQLAMELYSFMCLRPGNEVSKELSASLNQTRHSVRLMNGTLALLGLPPLEGSVDMKQEDTEITLDQPASSQDLSGRNVFVSSKCSTDESDKCQLSHSESSHCSVELPSSKSSENDCPPITYMMPAGDSGKTPSHSCASDYIQPFQGLIKHNLSKEKQDILSATSQQINNGIFSDISATFPVRSASKIKCQQQKQLSRTNIKRFVGLPLSIDEFLLTNCPPLVQNINVEIEDKSIEIPAERELDAQVITTNILPSAPFSTSCMTTPVDLRKSTSPVASEACLFENLDIKPDKSSDSSWSNVSSSECQIASSSKSDSNDSSFVDLTATTKSATSDLSIADASLSKNALACIPLVDLSSTTKSTSSASVPLVDLSSTTKSTSSASVPLVDLSSTTKSTSSASFPEDDFSSATKSTHASIPEVDLSSSTKSTSSASVPVVDLSSCTKSTSSASFPDVDLSSTTKSTSSSSVPLVDLSSSTKSTSSATADSEGSSFEILKKKSIKCFDSSWTKSSLGDSLNVSHRKSSQMNSNGPLLVDLSATTKSTSSDTSEREECPPLVDLSTPSACSILSELKLGSSIETSDSNEFLANWTPLPDKSVHRAVLLTYNPVTEQWTSQSTLAYIGPQLNTERKGSYRDAVHVSFLHQDEPLGRYVGKRYRQQKKPEAYMQDVVTQMLAGYYVTLFNQALQHCHEDILQVQFLTAAHLQLLTADGEIFDWINVEPFLHGSFLKLTNNLRFVSSDNKDESGVEAATALSHFSYVKSGGKEMVVDLQGWLPSQGKGIVYLTDPVFHTRYRKKFSTCDHQEEGMKAFWKHVHPKCNKICAFLGLQKFRPDIDI